MQPKSVQGENMSTVYSDSDKVSMVSKALCMKQIGSLALLPNKGHLLFEINRGLWRFELGRADFTMESGSLFQIWPHPNNSVKASLYQ